MVLAVAAVGIESELAVGSSICRMVPSSIYASGTKIAPSRYCYHCRTKPEVLARIPNLYGRKARSIMNDEHFDAVIIGSGFGGSVMAYRLAEAGLQVCLLERGKA